MRETDFNGDRASRRGFWTDAWFVSGLTGTVAGFTYIGGMTLIPGGPAAMWGWMLAAMVSAGIVGMILDHMVGMVEAAVAGMVVPMALMAASEGAWPWLFPVAVLLISAGMEIIHWDQTRGARGDR